MTISHYEGFRMRENGPNGYAKQIRDEVFSACGLVLKKVGTRYEGEGWPDLYVPSPIWHGWIELKVNRYTLSVAQKTRMRALLLRGVPCVVLRWTRDGERIEKWDGEVIAARNGAGGRALLLQLREMCGDVDLLK